jgi:hypothetical protein
MSTTLGDWDAFTKPVVRAAIATGYPAVRFLRSPSDGHVPWFDQPGPVVEEIDAALANGAPTSHGPGPLDSVLMEAADDALDGNRDSAGGAMLPSGGFPLGQT